ncbi:MAG TPA: ribosome small subunit-dependent GTPase A [Steroidobacteraceae bacterium]|nr:ribosome small subunit-dependent GTPase A [Steroidobacteraceae bacterium]
MAETFEATVLQARVVATFGRHLMVRDGAGRELRARPFGRSLAVVCGDQVRCRADPRHEELHVVEVLPRESALYRTNLRGRSEPVVANLQHLLVVLAPVPVPDLFVVDRYLCAAGSAGLSATLIVNKDELGVAAPLAAELAAYAAAGYRVVRCSAHTGAGSAELLAAVPAGAVAALVGQSGVGKSSLVARLLPQQRPVIGELASDEAGRHTTTAARLFELPGERGLIDSPGVRDFAPAIERLEPRSLGFVEVGRLAADCRFLDCQHLREPDCAVRAALGAGTLHARRYESYRRLRRLREELSPARAPRRRR